MAKSNIIKGTTKSGIKFSIDNRILKDAKVVRKMAKLSNPDVKEDPVQAVNGYFDLLEMVFGGPEGFTVFMDEVAAHNDGICNTETLIAEANEVIGAVSPKN